MVQEVAALATMVPSIVGGIFAKVAHNKYANMLDSSKLSLPKEWGRAGDLYSNLAVAGLPGADQAKVNLQNSTASTLKQLQEASQNPADILGALGDAQSDVSKGLTNIDIQNALAKITNSGQLASFLTQKGAAEGQYDMYNNQLKFSAEAERMAGTKELLSGISGGISGGVSAVGNVNMANKLDAYLNPPKIDAPTAPTAGSTLDVNSIVSSIMGGGDFLGTGKPYNYNPSYNYKLPKSMMDAYLMSR